MLFAFQSWPVLYTVGLLINIPAEYSWLKTLKLPESSLLSCDHVDKVLSSSTARSTRWRCACLDGYRGFLFSRLRCRPVALSRLLSHVGFSWAVQAVVFIKLDLLPYGTFTARVRPAATIRVVSPRGVRSVGIHFRKCGFPGWVDGRIWPNILYLNMQSLALQGQLACPVVIRHLMRPRSLTASVLNFIWQGGFHRFNM